MLFVLKVNFHDKIFVNLLKFREFLIFAVVILYSDLNILYVIAMQNFTKVGVVSQLQNVSGVGTVVAVVAMASTLFGFAKANMHIYVVTVARQHPTLQRGLLKHEHMFLCFVCCDYLLLLK